jgi:hypothetical protein
VLACPNSAITKRAATLVKAVKSVHTSTAGFSGACDAAIALCSVLDVAEADETILVLSAVRRLRRSAAAHHRSAGQGSPTTRSARNAPRASRCRT